MLKEIYLYNQRDAWLSCLLIMSETAEQSSMQIVSTTHHQHINSYHQHNISAIISTSAISTHVNINID
jgi:hypothetical protein